MTKKIAVLITGEYRTFDIAAKTMRFLQDEKVDVYVSTWNKSFQVNKHLGIDIEESVDLKRVQAAIHPKKLFGHCIEANLHYRLGHYKYNEPMMHRWKKGLRLILNSGVEYDAIMVVRPDLYFQLDWITHFQGFDQYDIDGMDANTLYSAWTPAPETRKMDDILFFGKPDVIHKTIGAVSIKEWSDSDEMDWHAWFRTAMEATGVDIKMMSPQPAVFFCRANCQPEDDYMTNYRKAIIWRNAFIEEQRVRYGDEKVIELWGSNILAELEEMKQWK
jgi:hypothetical protein